jgi:hypothetical protein
MAKIIAVCKSETKGVKKEDVKEGLLKEDFGLVGDAHADCCTHRQVSLLAVESIDKMRALGLELKPGDFAENLTTWCRCLWAPGCRSATRLYWRSLKSARSAIPVAPFSSRWASA